MSCLLIITLFSSSHADTIEFSSVSQVTAADGLPSSTIFSVEQDSSGFIWLGTPAGIGVLDGYEAKSLKSKSQLLPQIPILNPANLFIDSKNRVWIGSWGEGIGRINASRKRYLTYTPDDSPSSIKSDKIQTFYESIDGTIWIGTYDGGFAKYDEEHSTFVNYQYNDTNLNSLVNNRVWNITEGEADELWIGTSSGLSLFNRKTSNFKNYLNDDDLSIGDKTIRALIYQDKKLWIGTSLGFGQYSPESNLYTRYTPAGFEALTVNKILSDGKEGIWLATFKGVFFFDTNTKKFKTFSTGELSFAPDKDVRDMHLTESGLLLLATRHSGLIKVNTKPYRFSRVLPHPDSPISSDFVWGMAMDAEGHVWAGSNSGVSRFDPVTKRHLDVPDVITQQIKNRVLPVVTSHEGQVIWFGSTDNLYSYDLRDKSLKEYRDFLSRNGLNHIINLFADQNDNIWISASHQGVFMIGSDGSKEYYANTETDEHFINTNTIVDFGGDQQGTIWAVTGNSRLLYKPQYSKRFRPLTYVIQGQETLPDFISTSMLVSSEEHIYISTFSGLIEINLVNLNARLITINDGLSNNEIRSITMDSEGNLWLSTGIGVSIYYSEEGRSRNFFEHDGLSSSSLNLDSSLMLADGSVFFGTNNGVNTLNSKLVEKEHFTLPLVITAIWVNNVKQASPVFGEQIIHLDLSSEQRNITIQYALLDHRPQSDHDLKYKLEGFDDSWIRGNVSRLATYTNLEPGQYRFVVSADEKLGDSDSSFAAVEFVITPPFWETKRFKFLSIFLILTISIAAYKIRVQQIRKTELRLNKLVQARTQNMALLSEIGQEITKSLSFEEIFEKLQLHLKEVLDGHVFMLGLVNHSAGAIDFRMVIKDSNLNPGFLVPLNRKDSPSVWCIENRLPLLSHNKKDLLEYIGAPSDTIIKNGMESHICIPLITENNVIGVICAESVETSAYGDYELQFLHTVASYTAIAIANANFNRQQQDMHRKRISWLENISHYLRHEMKNSMLGAQTSLSMLKRKSNDGELQKYLERATKSHEEMKAIMNAVSDTTTLEASIISSISSKLELSLVVQNRIHDYSLVYPDIVIEANIQPGIFINGSADLINQLLDKLINNAVEHHTQNTPVVIKLNRVNNGIVLTVINRGDPLPDNTKTLFDLFVSTKSAFNAGNFGMGLYIAKLVADFHQGHIMAKTIEFEGQVGAEFRVEIPSYESTIT